VGTASWFSGFIPVGGMPMTSGHPPLRHYRGTAARPVITATLSFPTLWLHPPRRVMFPLVLRCDHRKGWHEQTGDERDKRHVGTAAGRGACLGMFASGGRTVCICRRRLPARGKQEARSPAGEGL